MMTDRDKDGFISLVRKTAMPLDVKSPSKRHDKPAKHPFKKGSWKAWMYKKLTKLRTPKSVRKFHDTKLSNLVIYRSSDPKAVISNKRFTEATLDRLAKRHPLDYYLLINTGLNTYIRVSLESYLAMAKIERLTVNMELYARDDYDCDPYLIQEFDYTMFSINELLNFVNYMRQLIDGVAEVQAQCCGFTFHEYKFHTVVLMENGKAHAFKGDFNEVLRWLKIEPLL